MILSFLEYVFQPPLVRISMSQTLLYLKLKDLSYHKISSKRYCVGYDIEGFHIPCGKEIKRGYQCEKCKRKDVFRKCAMCKGVCINPNIKAKEWCNQKFFVYLAYFGGKIVKVGVAAKKRLKIRLLEQGAIAYKIIREFENGREARVFENKLKNKFLDRLTYKQKLLLYKQIDLDWFDNNFGIDEILKYNFNNLKFLKQINTNPSYIGKVISSLGPFILTEKETLYFPFLRGRKIII